jgi:hypothetical protein
MSRAGGPVTGGGRGTSGRGARVAAGAVVVGVAATRFAVVVVGRGAAVVGTTAAGMEVVVGATVVVVVADVVVEDSATGRSTTATWRVLGEGLTPAGDAPAHVEAPTSAAARSGLPRTGLIEIARIGR